MKLSVIYNSPVTLNMNQQSSYSTWPLARFIPLELLHTRVGAAAEGPCNYQSKGETSPIQSSGGDLGLAAL